jgi:hypothetical protein
MEITKPNDLLQLQDRLANQLKPDHRYDQLNNADKFTVSESLLVNIGQTTGKLNQMLLPLLWECYLTGQWQNDPLREFRVWLEDEIMPFFPEESRNYIYKMAAGVRNVLTTAYAAEKSGIPILDDHCNPVTVERLLEAPSKVVEYAYHIGQQKEPEKFLALLPTHSQTDLNKLRQADDLSVESIQAETYYHAEGGYRIVIDVPDQRTLNLIERLLKKIVRFSMPKSQ